MKLRILFIASFLIGSSFTMAAQKKEKNFSNIDSLVESLYSVISGPASQRDWDLFRSLFHKDALMGHTSFKKSGEREFKFFTPEDYIKKNQEIFLTRDFHEKELGRVVNVYGGIADVFSAYEYELENNDQLIKQRGVNSFHLVFDKGRWFVSQLIFEPETPGNPIPDKYLLKGNKGINSDLSQETNSEKRTTIFFVRHSEKEETIDSDPNLSEKGKKDANRLANLLKSKDISGIYSTPYKRTTQTAEPLSERIGKEILIYDPRDPNALTTILEKNKGKNILIVGHSNTVPMMINFLAKENKVETIPESEYNILYRVELSEGNFSLTKTDF